MSVEHFTSCYRIKSRYGPQVAKLPPFRVMSFISKSPIGTEYFNRLSTKGLTSIFLTKAYIFGPNVYRYSDILHHKHNTTIHGWIGAVPGERRVSATLDLGPALPRFLCSVNMFCIYTVLY